MPALRMAYFILTLAFIFRRGRGRRPGRLVERKLRYRFENYVLDTDRRELRQGGEPGTPCAAGFRYPRLSDPPSRACHQQGRSLGRRLGRTDRFGIRVDDATERRPKGDRRQRRGTAADQNTSPQGGPLRRRRLRGKAASRHAQPEIHRRRAPALVSQEQPSIVVLPFTNLSGDPLQDYFTDGVVEDITTELSRFSELFVIARNSSFTYKGRAVDVRAVGRDLGVRYVLEGSVRKVDKRVRITGQLIDAESGKHIWADRFESSLEDIFALQDQMAHSVVGAIAPRLEQAEIERAKRKPTESLSAYDCFLRGMAGWHDWTRSGHDAALKQFYRAIELDPTFARPHALAAGCFLMRKSNGWMVDRAAETAETERLARLGADLGRTDAVALAWSAHALAHVVGDIKAGIALIDHALRLNPNLAVAWQRSGWIRVYAGELRGGDRAPPNCHAPQPAGSADASRTQRHGLRLFLSWRPRSSLPRWSDRALQMRPDWPAALRVSAMSDALAGRERQHGQAMTRLRALQPTLRLSNLHEQMFLHRPEHMDEVHRGDAESRIARVVDGCARGLWVGTIVNESERARRQAIDAGRALLLLNATEIIDDGENAFSHHDFRALLRPGQLPIGWIDMVRQADNGIKSFSPNRHFAAAVSGN